MRKRIIILAVLFLTIFYFTTDIIIAVLNEKTHYISMLLLLCVCGIFESVIATFTANKILNRKQIFIYGIIFLTLYILLFLISYIAFQAAIYNQTFSEKYWVYFPSLISTGHMSIAIGGHLLTLYLLSKRKHN